MRSRGAPKAGIYFSHYECFGHTSRVIAVGNGFKKRFPGGDLFFIQGGAPQPGSRIEELGARMYALPDPFMGRRNFRQPVSLTQASVQMRGEACKDIVSRERPDLLVTEFFPLGREECRHELIPSLAKASLQGAAVWSMAGYPLLTGADDDWRRKFLKLYKRIIIFSPPQEKEHIASLYKLKHQRQKYLEFFENYAPMIKFAGYLLPQQEVVRDEKEHNFIAPPVPPGACRVAVLRGGGAYFPKLIAQAIRAGDRLGKEYYLSVVAGPSTTPEEWYFFNTLAGKKRIKNLSLFRSVGDYEGLIRNSDVCVSVASYHTSVMLLKHRKKAVLVPFRGQSGQSVTEQPARAELLKEMIGADVLSLEDLTAENLAEAVGKAAKSAQISSQIPEEWFAGGDVLDQELTGLFGR
jgi:predicted glycosyltransferase